jgi:HemY protein
MARSIFLFVILAFLALAAVWLADYPGTVKLTWGGYVVETSIVVIAALTLVFAVIVAFLYRFWVWMKGGPGRIGAVFSARRREKGLEALSSGMVAIAAGDAVEARRQAIEAEKHLSGEPMTLLLAAQAAELNEDDRAARIYYDRMIARDDTEFLGLRGLINRARKENDNEKAISLAKRADELRPGTGWVLKELYDLALATRDWDMANKTISRMARGKAAKGAAVVRAKAVISYERALILKNQNKNEEALPLAIEAHDMDPTFVPAAILAVTLTAKLESPRKLTKIIADCWKNAPHKELAEAIRTVQSGEQPPDWLRRAEQTVATHNPDHIETHLMLARAALASRDWGPARDHLMKAINKAPAASMYYYLAELEEKANADAIAAREWILKSATVPQDPLWICNSCGRQEETWSSHCPACAQFDSFSWRTADRGPHLQEAIEVEVIQEISASSAT